MKSSYPILVVGVGVILFAFASYCCGQTKPSENNQSIPYVVTHHDAVRDMLWMCDVGKDDVVYDLGSGDGRIVIAAVRDFGARRAVGVEIKPELVKQSRQNAKEAGVADQVQFIKGDLFNADLRDASVVTLYLGHDPNLKLRPKLLRILEPGSRIVSHKFGMGEWPPDKSLTIRISRSGMCGVGLGPFSDNSHVPDYTGAEAWMLYSKDKIMMWVVPASVAGRWCGKVQTENGTKNVRLILHQRFSQISGRLKITGRKDRTTRVGGKLWGRRVTFSGSFADKDEKMPMKKQDITRLDFRFKGHVKKNKMKGLMQVSVNDKIQKQNWVVHREKSDYSGTWQWRSVADGAPAKLRIERRDGQYSATYVDVDNDKETPVSHFYDWGGGFYFAVLKDTGWLVGYAIVQQNRLKGSIAFYPDAGMGVGQDGVWIEREWEVQRVQPPDGASEESK